MPTTTVVFGVPVILGAAAFASDANKNVSAAANNANNEGTPNECTACRGARTLELNIDNPRGGRAASDEDVADDVRAAICSLHRVLRQPRVPIDKDRIGGFASPPCNGFALFKTLQGIFFKAKKGSPARGSHRYA